MRTTTLANRLVDILTRWADQSGITPDRLPPPDRLEATFGGVEPLRPGASADRLDAWQEAHGFALPDALRNWLRLSDGFYLDAPLVHPLNAIGPMIPFARMPRLVVQPESWFELGNPGDETICIDLAYRWPGGDAPIFTSGDDESRSRPRIVAPSFEAWFLRLLHEGGRRYWFDARFASLGDPWQEHRLRAPRPEVPDGLRGMIPQATRYLYSDADERSIAETLGITRGELESLFRHLQHAPGS